MQARGLEVWLDEWSLIPGRRWIPELEKAIETAKTAAVLVGESGFGRWEQPEYEGALSEFVDRGLPVIPVLLPGAPAKIKLPLFLKGFTWVDLRGGITEEGIDRLVWGIKGEQPDREKKPAKSGAPKIHNLPFLSLGDLLKGRDEELRTLETNLHDPSAATAITQAQAIHGLGGIGKTRLAVEYAWRAADRFDAELFVVADSPEALRSGLAGLARIGLPGVAPILDRAQEEELATVVAWLRSHDRWLLILDNVDTEEAARAVQGILPQLGNGHVLITSRRRDWSPAVQRQSLGTLSPEEATQFLLQRTQRAETKIIKAPTKQDEPAGNLGNVVEWLQGKNAWLVVLDPEGTEADRQSVVDLLPLLEGNVLVTSQRREEKLRRISPSKAQQFLQDQTEAMRPHESGDPEQARRLALLLDNLPLALEQAAAYIIQHETSFAGYLADWEKERSKILEWSDPDAMQYPASVAVTWQRSFRQLQPISATILRLAGYLASDPIPLDIFEKGSTAIQEAVTLFCQEANQETGSMTVREGLAELVAYSLISRNDRTFTIHPMVQEVLRTQVPKEHRREWVEKALRLINEASPLQAEDVRTWPVWDVLLPHAVAIVTTADGFQIANPTARLMAQLALFFKTRGLYSEAEPLMRRALEIDLDFFGPGHPNVAIDLNNLAQLLQAINRLEEAEPLMRQALKIEGDSFGVDHPNIARDLNNLAQLLQATNRLAEAEPLMRRALKIDQDSFGMDHPNVATGLNNLAQLLKDTNRLEEAEPLMRRALKIDEDSFGTDHPEVATDLSNLAQLLQDTNRLAVAEPLIRRALKIDEDSFGPDHPNVAIDLNNLAQLLKATNRLPEAEPLMRRAVEIFEASLGPDHPDSKIARSNLAALLTAMRSEEPSA